MMQCYNVWPPGSADTVCPRRPLTQVQYWAKTAQTDHVILRRWPLTLEVMAPEMMRAVVLHPYTKSDVRIGLAVPKLWRTMCVSINGPGDLDLWHFDLDIGTWVASKVGNLHLELGPTRPSGSQVIRYVHNGRTDGRTDTSQPYCPFLRAGA